MLTGVPGVGKTTVVRTVAASLSDLRLAGFSTDEIRVTGERRGFRLVTFDGRERVMAHVDFRSPHRVGKYGVDVAAIDAEAESSLAVRRDVDLYLVDEIGKMECLSERFIRAMSELLDSGEPVVATIALKGGGFIERVRRRRDVELHEVTRRNRDELPERVLAWVRVASGGAKPH